MYVCKCGREFEKTSSYAAHTGHCKIYRNGKKPIDRFGNNRGWAKGLTKDDPRIEKLSKASKTQEAIEKQKQSYMKWTKENPDRIQQRNKKQSETRKKEYESGELSPAKGIGRGKYSYIIYKGNKIMLRSTYEFIFAYWLYLNGFDFEYESIRITHKDKTYISDFAINGKVFEVKGYTNSHTYESLRAFRENGYDVELVNAKRINEIKEALINAGIEIDSLLEKVIEGHNKKDYFVFKLS